MNENMVTSSELIDETENQCLNVHHQINKEMDVEHTQMKGHISNNVTYIILKGLSTSEAHSLFDPSFPVL